MNAILITMFIIIFILQNKAYFFPLNRISHSYGWLGTLCSFNSDSLGSICLVFGLSL